jgi:hypothetical protein
MIHGERRRLGKDADYLRKTHAEFHQCAADVIKHKMTHDNREGSEDSQLKVQRLTDEVIREIDLNSSKVIPRYFIYVAPVGVNRHFCRFDTSRIIW